jgi:hypothetical protein
VTHACPVPHCIADVPDKHLMCKFHWYRVSAETRARVWQAWRAYQQQNLTWEQYAEVRQLAIREATEAAAADAERMRRERL